MTSIQARCCEAILVNERSYIGRSTYKTENEMRTTGGMYEEDKQRVRRCGRGKRIALIT